jgi:hypothetical protein
MVDECSITDCIVHSRTARQKSYSWTGLDKEGPPQPNCFASEGAGFIQDPVEDYARNRRAHP